MLLQVPLLILFTVCHRYCASAHMVDVFALLLPRHNTRHCRQRPTMLPSSVQTKDKTIQRLTEELGAAAVAAAPVVSSSAVEGKENWLAGTANSTSTSSSDSGAA